MKDGSSSQPISKLAIASLVVSIIELFLHTLILGIVAIILGAVALGGSGKSGRGMAKAGLIIGIIDVIIAIGAYIMLYMAFSRMNNAYNLYSSFLFISNLFTIFA